MACRFYYNTNCNKQNRIDNNNIDICSHYIFHKETNISNTIYSHKTLSNNNGKRLYKYKTLKSP